MAHPVPVYMAVTLTLDKIIDALKISSRVPRLDLSRHDDVIINVKAVQKQLLQVYKTHHHLNL